jgi:hypothetical protein
MSVLTDEQITIGEREWREKRAEEDRKRESARNYAKDCCHRFGLEYEERAPIKARAEKKCRAIVEYLELAPTGEDLASGKVFKTEREEFLIFSAFVSTKQGGLIACFEIIHRDFFDDRYGHSSGESMDFTQWLWRKVHEHQESPEDIAYKEDWKRRRAEETAKREEWEKKNGEARWAERSELYLDGDPDGAPICEKPVAGGREERDDLY